MENTIVLTDAERIEPNQRAASRSGQADDARRARTLLLLEAGYTWAAIRDKLDCNDAFIDRWSKRFREERLAGLFSRWPVAEKVLPQSALLKIKSKVTHSEFE